MFWPCVRDKCQLLLPLLLAIPANCTRWVARSSAQPVAGCARRAEIA